ncbi:hypothetical protein Tco_0885623, partial [Tanacetum coccineum]
DEQARIEQAGIEQAGGAQAQVHVTDPEVPNPSSSLTLSSAKYGLDEAIAKGKIDPKKVLKKRRHYDKDPSADSEKGKKKIR